MGNPQLHRVEIRRLIRSSPTAWLRAIAERLHNGAPIRTASAARMLAAALAVFAAMASPIAARSLDEVKASSLLRVVAYDDNKPFSWSEGGIAHGIDVEIGRALAQKLGVQVEIILRMQGETVDDDLRANIWRGPLTGGPVGDVMLHVPIDKELVIRNKEAVMGAPYFEERVAIAIDTPRTGDTPTLDVFKREKIAVQLGTVADYFLMFHDGGALRPNIMHFIKPKDGVDRLLGKDVAGLMGVRSHIEGLLHTAGRRFKFIEPPMPGIARASWTIGIAVKENSRDLYYAVANLLGDMHASGELGTIFARHGVTYAAPPVR